LPQWVLKGIVLILLFFAPIVGLARINSNWGVWTGADFHGPFQPKSHWCYNGLLQPRFADVNNGLGELVFQPSVQYNFFNGFSLWAGYDLRPTTALNGVTTFLEQRVWPQAQYRWHALKKLDVSFRTRYEYRWRDNQSQQSQRLRQRVELTFLDIIRGGVDFDLFDEVFFNLNHPSWVTNNTVGVNWIFIGFIIPIYKYFAIDTGYLNVYRPMNPSSRMDHVVVFMLSTNFDSEVEIPIDALS